MTMQRHAPETDLLVHDVMTLGGWPTLMESGGLVLHPLGGRPMASPDILLFNVGTGRSYYRKLSEAAGTATWTTPDSWCGWTRREYQTESDKTSEHPPFSPHVVQQSAIQERISELVQLGDDWDSEGAEAITEDVAKRAANIVESVSDIVGDPFVAPAPDGSVFIEWEFPSKTSVAIFVEQDAFPLTASVKMAGKVHRVRINPERLRLILMSLAEVTKSPTNASAVGSVT